MSIWADMHRVSTGEMTRKEDSVDDENLWQFDIHKWNDPNTLEKMADEVLKEHARLNNTIDDLRRKLSKFNNGIIKCHYKL